MALDPAAVVMVDHHFVGVPVKAHGALVAGENAPAFGGAPAGVEHLGIGHVSTVLILEDGSSGIMVSGVDGKRTLPAAIPEVFGVAHVVDDALHVEQVVLALRTFTLNRAFQAVETGGHVPGEDRFRLDGDNPGGCPADEPGQIVEVVGGLLQPEASGE